MLLEEPVARTILLAFSFESAATKHLRLITILSLLLASVCWGATPFATAPETESSRLLKLVVVDGLNESFAAGKMSYRGFVVRVTNEVGRPVPDAQVTFQLPEQAPTGAFPGGQRTETPLSHNDAHLP